MTNSSLQKCGITSSKEGNKQCYRLEWQLEYLEYQSDKQTTITRDENYPVRDTYREDELRTQLGKYEVCELQ